MGAIAVTKQLQAWQEQESSYICFFLQQAWATFWKLRAKIKDINEVTGRT